MLEKAGIWRVGSGHQIQIWGDSWVHLVGGFKLFSGLEHQHRVAVVFDLIDAERRVWNAHLVSTRLQFSVYEAAQVLQISLPRTVLSDVFVWTVTNDGYFTTKSAYEFVMRCSTASSPSSSTHGVPNGFLNLLWSSKAIPRCKDLVWRVCSEVLPVKEVLVPRGLELDVACMFCDV